MTKQVAEQLYVSVWLTCEEVEEVMLSYEGRPVIGGDVHIHQNAQHLHKQVTVNVRSLHSPHHSLRLSMHSCLFFHMENPKDFFCQIQFVAMPHTYTQQGQLDCCY